MVELNDIENSIRELGVKRGDIVLVHSSLKSFGEVDGGAMTVINAFKNILTDNGTLVMPTLSQTNFKNAIEDWTIYRPSDVGLITEIFRKLPDSHRSDQETHSVSAWGKFAEEITGSHKLYGSRYGTFGEWAFSHSSPWQKMYDMYAKTVFLGVTMKYYTFKHFVEYRLVEEVLSNVDKSLYEQCKGELRYSLGEGAKEGVWPFYSSELMQEELEKRGLVSHSKCGDAELICVPVHETCDQSDCIIRKDFRKWIDENAAWFERYGSKITVIS